ncbi:hypothetical protein [Streptomyces sp. NPDC020681]|uniref:hypothetical protein n=1 Tax=Streptomyces sp. NPDC020681 TaxID=3365083 RepID=UPI0037BA3240
MSASERETQPRQESARPMPPAPSALSMRDLLASCAAASAVSTPPRDEHAGEREPRRDAA